MSNTTVIDYEDSDGKGTVTLVANPFGKGGKYYARFARTTVNIDHLIARIQKKEVGTNAIMAKHFASLFKAEILEALARGEAVNVLDLGTLYIKANGTVAGNSPETAVLEGFQVKFTSSKLVNDAVAKIGVKKIVTADSGPVIGDMTDLYTGKAGTCSRRENPCALRERGSGLQGTTAASILPRQTERTTQAATSPSGSKWTTARFTETARSCWNSSCPQTSRRAPRTASFSGRTARKGTR